MTEKVNFPGSGRDQAPFPMVISADGLPAGFAVAGTGGFRFLAAHRRFGLLDGSRFGRIEEVRAAARRLAAATR